MKQAAYGIEFDFPRLDKPLEEYVMELVMWDAAPRFMSGIAKPENHGHKGKYSGEGRWWHGQKLNLALFKGTYQANPWSDEMERIFSEYQWSTVTGPKSAAKTTTAAAYAIKFWLSAPAHSAVIMTSTTVQGLRKRVWGETMRLWRPIGKHVMPCANLIESRMELQTTHGDSRHGIFGIPVSAGQTEKALGRIIGFHPKRLLIIVDEMTDTPEAIVDACANLSKVEIEFQFIGIGNAKDRLDPHGRMSEPKDGWNSIGVDDEFWDTKLGACLHLDGTKSPNLACRGIKPKFPYLLTQKDIDKDIKQYGENSPKFWRFVRGFWPPEDFDQKVVTEAMFAKFSRCKMEATWLSTYRPIAALDPAFGGDRCMLRFGRFGLGAHGKHIIEFTEAIALKLDAGSSVPIHFQIATMTREMCKQHGVEPECFAIDATGGGSGTADILRREWSPRIHVINFNDRPSERPVSDNNPRACREEYYNTVTELWFAFRRFLESDQLRGIKDEDIFEFCARPWDYKGNLMQVLPKPDMKKLIGRSPDLADADALLLEVVRRHGINPQTSDAPTYAKETQKVADVIKRNDIDSNPDNYIHHEWVETDFAGMYGTM